MVSLNNIKVGFAMTGSFCTFEAALELMERLKNSGAELTPIMSECAYSTDTRFGDAGDIIRRVEELCGREIISSITDAEPIGPKGLIDVLLIAPCTGNTLAKLAHGVNDSAVTMAAKAHLRNGRPVLLAVSTNDGLSGSAENIGRLLNRRNIYFLPFYQDDPVNKPRSLASRYELAEESILAALEGRQIQPILG